MKKRIFSVILSVTLMFASVFTGCAAEKEFFSSLVQKSGQELLTEQEEAQTESTYENSESEAARANTEEENGQPDLRYAYQTLPQNERDVYNEIYDAITSYEKDIVVSTLDKEILDKVYHCVMADHGGLFWISGYSYTQYTRGEELVRIRFSPKYTMEQQEKETLQEQIDAAVEGILNGIMPDASDYEKAKYVFDYLASEISYDTQASDNQNIISVFLNKATVCQGYACATQYLLEKLGIICAIVSGEANNTAHAWNIVRLDGEYYYIDTTWGNATYSGESGISSNYINYNYFAVTTEEIEATHHVDDEIILPVCTAVKDNYYVHENLFLPQWDAQAAGQILADAYYGGAEFCSIKFEDRTEYEEAFRYFITEQHIIDYCKEMTSLYYIEDDTQNVLTIKF